MAFRILFVLIVVALNNLPVRANEIDGLKTISEVNAFLKKIQPEHFETIALDEKNTSKTEFGKNTFHKVDIDSDGATDLVVENLYLLLIKAVGNEKYELVPIDKGSLFLRRFTLLNIVKDGKDNALLIKPAVKDEISVPENDKEKTIVWKFGGLVEANLSPDNFKIESISISTSGCFGSCAIFQMDIKANRKAKYIAKQYNNPDGNFVGTIDEKSYEQLVQTLNYIGLSKLKSNYSVPWTDDQSSQLKIVFNGGKVKKISDYGMIGTFGLENLYDQLFELRKNQKWTPK